MTAQHHCPHCDKIINYHPNKYHQHVRCMRCKETFGFKLYTTGPRIEAALREELLQKAAARQKKGDSDASRAARAKPLSLPEALTA